jgi:hypothetical protein
MLAAGRKRLLQRRRTAIRKDAYSGPLLRALGPQPSAHGTSSLNSGTLEDGQNVPGLFHGISRMPLAPPEVPTRVPAESKGIACSLDSPFVAVG